MSWHKRKVDNIHRDPGVCRRLDHRDEVIFIPTANVIPDFGCVDPLSFGGVQIAFQASGVGEEDGIYDK